RFRLRGKAELSNRCSTPGQRPPDEAGQKCRAGGIALLAHERENYERPREVGFLSGLKFSNEPVSDLAVVVRCCDRRAHLFSAGNRRGTRRIHKGWYVCAARPKR